MQTCSPSSTHTHTHAGCQTCEWTQGHMCAHREADQQMFGERSWALNVIRQGEGKSLENAKALWRIFVNRCYSLQEAFYDTLHSLQGIVKSQEQLLCANCKCKKHIFQTFWDHWYHLKPIWLTTEAAFKMKEAHWSAVWHDAADLTVSCQIHQHHCNHLSTYSPTGYSFVQE